MRLCLLSPSKVSDNVARLPTVEAQTAFVGPIVGIFVKLCPSYLFCGYYDSFDILVLCSSL